MRNFDSLATDVPYTRPMSPAFTLRAIRETPRLGNTTARTRVPGPTTSLLIDKMIVKTNTDGIDAELAAIERAQQIDICGIVLCVYACLLQSPALLTAYQPRRGRKLVIESDGLASLKSYFQQALPQGRASSHKATDLTASVTAGSPPEFRSKTAKETNKKAEKCKMILARLKLVRCQC